MSPRRNGKGRNRVSTLPRPAPARRGVHLSRVENSFDGTRPYLAVCGCGWRANKRRAAKAPATSDRRRHGRVVDHQGRTRAEAGEARRAHRAKAAS